MFDSIWTEHRFGGLRRDLLAAVALDPSLSRCTSLLALPRQQRLHQLDKRVATQRPGFSADAGPQCADWTSATASATTAKPMRSTRATITLSHRACSARASVGTE